MIYIYYTKYGGKGVVCVLAVRDDELDVGGVEDASSELAEGRDTCGKGSWEVYTETEQNTWGGP